MTTIETLLTGDYWLVETRRSTGVTVIQSGMKTRSWAGNLHTAKIQQEGGARSRLRDLMHPDTEL